jgi:hypothetical protein
VIQLAPGQVFEAAGRLWRLSCPALTGTVGASDSPPRLRIADLRLTIAHSRDEEHVRVGVAAGGVAIDVGESVYFHILLTLARRRLEDAADGFAPTSCGWVYNEDLCGEPTMTLQSVNMAVFRIRQIFDRIGVVDSATIVERRNAPRQLRIGTGRLRVVPL